MTRPRISVVDVKVKAMTTGKRKAAAKPKSWRVWVVTADVGPNRPTELAHYDDGPILLVFETKRADYLFAGEQCVRATLTLDPPRPQRRRKQP